ncbi:unnamed protein product [Scytosiphon promiscuus]
MADAHPPPAKKQKDTDEEEKEDVFTGSECILLSHQQAISEATFSATGKRIKTFTAIGSPVESKSFSAQDAGRKALKAQTEDGDLLFVKINTVSDAVDRFYREIEGLHAMRRTRSVRVPKVVTVAAFGRGRGGALVLEYVKMRTMLPADEYKFGLKLARMHDNKHGTQFGFPSNTWCGTLLQKNDWNDDWCDFFSTQRLGQQSKMILDKYGDKEIATKIEDLRVNLRERFFKDVDIKPRLLHGNLWSRNWGVDIDGLPVVYNPATYFGHHEVDMSMLAMFGAPCKGFFVNYHDIVPRSEAGYDNRVFLYQLHHFLSLYLQFGRGFRITCLAMANLLLGSTLPRDGDGNGGGKEGGKGGGDSGGEDGGGSCISSSA